MSEANIKLVQDVYAAFGRGDLAAILKRTADVDWQTLGPVNEYPTFGRRLGKAAVQEFFAYVAATEDFSDFSPREFCASGDKVIVFGSYAGKIKQTGQPFACEWSHVFTVKGGKTGRFREYTDAARFIAAYRG